MAVVLYNDTARHQHYACEGRTSKQYVIHCSIPDGFVFSAVLVQQHVLWMISFLCLHHTDSVFHWMFLVLVPVMVSLKRLEILLINCWRILSDISIWLTAQQEEYVYQMNEGVSAGFKVARFQLLAYERYMPFILQVFLHKTGTAVTFSDDVVSLSAGVGQVTQVSVNENIMHNPKCVTPEDQHLRYSSLKFRWLSRAEL